MPNFSIGTISQRAWRNVGGGPLDDCWLCADAQCILAVFPWLPLRSADQYRAAAGVPDTDAGHNGGSLDQSLKAIKALYPTIAPLVSIYRGPWSGFRALLTAGHVASASCHSLPLGYSTVFDHRLALFDDPNPGIRGVDPLDPAFALPRKYTEAQIQQAMADHPDTAPANALIFPTDAEAFKLHPLYSNASEQQLAAAKSIGFTQGKTRAAEAAAAVQEA